MSKRTRNVAGPKAKPAPAAPQSRREIVDESIEDAMRPYLGVLPPEALRTMRDILEDTMATHPVALAALDELEGRPAPDRSGTRVRDEARGADDEGGGRGDKGGAA